MHPILASYGGNFPFNPSSGSLTQTVGRETKPGRPTVSITDPLNGGHYALGQHVHARYSCHDAANGPGIKSCSAPVANGGFINTSEAGVHSLAVVATSKDGQSASGTVSYKVGDHK